MKIIKATFITSLFFLISCNISKVDDELSTPFDSPPSWANTAIWYQIFPERFFNGNINNDPTLTTCYGSFFDTIPNTWSVTPWSHEWVAQEDWAKASGKDFYSTIYWRRYGGDLEGVIKKIPYLNSLGINAVYFNPLNDAPSLHKYDARNYHHIDITFGTNIKKDLELIAKEDPSDSKTWKNTSADSIFIQLIDLLHKKDIKIIMDFSWNHTGTEFWAFKDVVKNQQSSKFKNWYEIKKWDDPTTKENEFEYEAWVGVKSLPELKKIRLSKKLHGQPFEGDMAPEVKQHIFDVTRRWLDPNGDGNPNDGIDGMRLDVAEHVPMGFWQDYRKFVRSINKDFYLVGENWWQQWPDTLQDAVPWMKGDVFDAVMHYQWYKPARDLFISDGKSTDVHQFYHLMDSIYGRYRSISKRALMNLGSSHDTERMLTSLANFNKYKYHSTPREDKNYICWQPDHIAYERMKALTLHQFTFIGAPHIFNGDEMGMYGGDDPDNRKPMWWNEINFDTEHFMVNNQLKSFTPKSNENMMEHYRKLILLRKENEVLANGEITYLKELNKFLAYKRHDTKHTLIVVINVSMNTESLNTEPYGDIIFEIGNNQRFNGNKSINLAPYGGIVFRKNNES